MISKANIREKVLIELQRYEGQKEFLGKNSNPLLQELLNKAQGHTSIELIDDSYPANCSLLLIGFFTLMNEKYGINFDLSNVNAMAKSFSKIDGTLIYTKNSGWWQQLQPLDILIFNRGENKASGHVSVARGSNSFNGNVPDISFNLSNTCKVRNYKYTKKNNELIKVIRPKCFDDNFVFDGGEWIDDRLPM